MEARAECDRRLLHRAAHAWHARQVSCLGSASDGVSQVEQHSLMTCTCCRWLNSGGAALSAKQTSCSPPHTQQLHTPQQLHTQQLHTSRSTAVLATEAVVALTLTVVHRHAHPAGEHPTTRLCLKFLLQQRQALEGKRLMDYGSGSGVLAIAALKFGAVGVVRGRTGFV